MIARADREPQTQAPSWPDFLAGFLAADPALHDCLARALERSDAYRLAAAAYAGGVCPRLVRALLLRAVMEAMP